MYTLRLSSEDIGEEFPDIEIKLVNNPDGSIGKIPEEGDGYKTYQSIVTKITEVLIKSKDLNRITFTVE